MNKTSLIRVPAEFYRNHVARGCTPCSPERTTRWHVWLNLADEGLDDLYEGACYCADEIVGKSDTKSDITLRASALATTKEIEKARRLNPLRWACRGKVSSDVVQVKVLETKGGISTVVDTLGFEFCISEDKLYRFRHGALYALADLRKAEIERISAEIREIKDEAYSAYVGS